ncbi:TetR family transcriptional regulator [Actinoplanes sp. KI2]|uniref:TetR/AcrR family transcriptional regulator n=1 Tax=Actinoplanes sp. KI2 TaxID=2983315 RepID=UPI0021D593F9|nr:TetR family transcriptional regulator [Actinoplanes sp. KI2]MCU7729517.1 TetR family transcriptional regulator [Actinoplanes sp. KI2]
MCSAWAPGGHPTADLTARAQLRNAAIAAFAEEGFDASFRTIAKRAGVSAGLITHHFGSKEGLRAECDAEVLRQYTAVKIDAVERPTDHLIDYLIAPGFAASLVVYMLRAIHAGGQPARDFLERIIDNARGVMAYSVETGMVKPSRDEEARLRYLTYQTLGALLVQFVTSPGRTPEEFIASIQAGRQDQILPTLELFTEGFLADRTVLDNYLTYLHDRTKE